MIMLLTTKQLLIKPLLLAILDPEKLQDDFDTILDNLKTKLTTYDCQQLLNIIKEEKQQLATLLNRNLTALMLQEHDLELLRQINQHDSYTQAKEKMNKFQEYVRDRHISQDSI